MADEQEVVVREEPKEVVEPVVNKNSPQEHNITGELDHSTYPAVLKGK